MSTTTNTTIETIRNEVYSILSGEKEFLRQYADEYLNDEAWMTSEIEKGLEGLAEAIAEQAESDEESYFGGAMEAVNDYAFDSIPGLHMGDIPYFEGQAFTTAHEDEILWAIEDALREASEYQEVC